MTPHRALAALSSLVIGCSVAMTTPPLDASADATHDGRMDPFDTGPRPDAWRDDTGPRPDVGAFACPGDGVIGSGRHRLFIQGAEGTTRPDGTWPFLHERRGTDDALLCDDTVFVDDTNGDARWEPSETPRSLGPAAIVHGEHFLVGAGAFVEFTVTLCDDITGEVAFYIANFDGTGSVALHELFLEHGSIETLIASATDDEPGFSGYHPFVRVLSGVDVDAQAGDTLLLRSTNVSGVPYSVMVWRPPSEYESWVIVEVP